MWRERVTIEAAKNVCSNSWKPIHIIHEENRASEDFNIA